MDPILQGLQHCIMDEIARNTDSTGTSAMPTTGVTFTLHLVLMPIPTGWKVSLEFRFPPIPTVPPPPQPMTHNHRGNSHQHRRHHRSHHQHRTPSPHHGRRQTGSPQSTTTSNETSTPTTSGDPPTNQNQPSTHHYYTYQTPTQLNIQHPPPYTPRPQQNLNRRVRFSMPPVSSQASRQPSGAHHQRGRH